MNKERLIEELEKELGALRPSARKDFQKAVGERNPGISEELFKKYFFDFERAPYIEKKGLDRARSVVVLVSPEAYPDPEMFLITCMFRVEAYLYEKYRPEADMGDNVDERSLMFKNGVRKVLRVLASKLEGENKRIWEFRRKVLDAVLDEMWRIELGLSGSGVAERLKEMVDFADAINSISPVEFFEISSLENFKSQLADSFGEAARDIINNFTAVD
ncbi:MAG TPA: hypothetical protein PLN69_01655 [bacterium]|nr:hypothetical protein [bacterium]